MDSGAYGQILRSKGFFTLASRPHVTGLWSQAGSVGRFEPSAARGTDGPAAQELVFIGTTCTRRPCTPRSPTACWRTARACRWRIRCPAWDTYGVDDTCDHESPELVART